MHPSSEQTSRCESSFSLHSTDRNMNLVADRQNMKQAHDVTFLAENSPAMLRRYESEEEEISEAETNGNGRMYSPVDADSDMGAFDSELSADEQASDDVQTRQTSSNRRSMLSPYLTSGQKSRPVSMETVKRSSIATFVPGSFYKDEEEVMSPATPLTTSPMPSPILRGTAVVVPADAPESEMDLYHQSSNRDSMSSVEDADSSLLVATPVMYMIPSTRPSLISIAPSSNRTSPTKEDNAARLRRGLSKSSRGSSGRSSTRPGRRTSQKRCSSLSLASTLSADSYTTSTTSQKQARRSSSRPSSMGGATPVHGRRHSRTESRSRNRETALIESPTLGFLAGEPKPGEETSATITNFSEMPPMPHPLSPRSMSFSFHAPLTFSPERQSIDVFPQSQRPASSLGPLGPRRISSFGTVDTSVTQGQRSFSSDSRKSFKPSLSHNLFKKGPRRNPRSISMSFRPVESPEPCLTASPVSYTFSPDSSHQRSVSTFDGGIGIGRENATYPYARGSSMLYTPLGVRSSSTMDLASTLDPIADPPYDADSGPSSSKEKSQKRTQDTGDSRAAGKSFMGIRLGRKKRVPTPTADNMI
ncbi:hypothetical protein DTO271D3_3110 [Paecilomyces variotii]|nr:hypothetical protein DTO271D3_3110 [Paecilomyces variotii]